jgi:hypothetical protein
MGMPAWAGAISGCIAWVFFISAPLILLLLFLVNLVD